MLIRCYKTFTWLSLDITAGAIIFMYFLSMEFGTPVHWSEAVALGLAVWIIYTVDHLLDARIANKPISPRRKFHRQYFKVLFFFTASAFCFGLWVMTLLSREIMITGGVLATLTVSYLTFIQIYERFAFKEILVAIGYAGGVSLIPFSYLELVVAWHWGSIVLLFLTALINLILFSWFERKQDQEEGFTSLVLVVGEEKVSMILGVIFVLVMIGTGVIMQVGLSLTLAIFFLLAVAINFCLSRYSFFFSQNNRYRGAIDAVFLLPLVWLL